MITGIQAKGFSVILVKFGLESFIKFSEADFIEN